ncbi:UNVERIFIED_CONTAM: hypothetical protein Sangu_0694800 [Sesamum angustifolium]|uniref:Uncharacterized protein n=1 Tax=Sesamum angustifolium TaxID=2727405 RepID=A0AAW2PRT5_9LAMI
MNMFPSSTSSSSQGSMDPTGSSGGGGGGLMRYPSAPGSLLSTAVESVIGATREFAPQTHLAPPTFFSNSEPSEPSHKPNIIHSLSRPNNEPDPPKTIGLQRSYGVSGGGASTSSLVRHSSSPAGFLNQLATAAGDNGTLVVLLFPMLELTLTFLLAH